MSWTTRVAAAAGLFGGLVSASSPSAAKNVCGRILFNDPTLFVLEKISTKTGAHGAVSGYFVREDDGQRSPFDGSYFYNGQELHVSVSQGVYTTGFGANFRHHNFNLGVGDPGSGNDYVVDVDGVAGTVSTLPSAPEVDKVDCKTVPKFLTPD